MYSWSSFLREITNACIKKRNSLRPPQSSEISSILKVSTKSGLLSTTQTTSCPFIPAPSFSVFHSRKTLLKVKTSLKKVLSLSSTSLLLCPLFTTIPAGQYCLSYCFSCPLCSVSPPGWLTCPHWLPCTGPPACTPRSLPLPPAPVLLVLDTALLVHTLSFLLRFYLMVLIQNPPGLPIFSSISSKLLYLAFKVLHTLFPTHLSISYNSPFMHPLLKVDSNLPSHNNTRIRPASSSSGLRGCGFFLSSSLPSSIHIEKNKLSMNSISSLIILLSDNIKILSLPHIISF